jgi:hypothetical protein
VNYRFRVQFMDCLVYLLKVGVIKADLCRLLVLYTFGGIYVDTDVVAYKSLDNIIPSKASMVSTERYSFEFIASVPRHPFILYCLQKSAFNILNEVYMCRTFKKCCRGAHSCIIKITGPDAYFQNIINISKTLGCTNMYWVPGKKSCKDSQNL